MKTAKDLRIPFTWDERKPIILDRFFYIPNQYDWHEKEKPISWPEIFGNEQPVHIEYCSGNGQWIGDIAKQNLGINWIAVEKRFDRARKVWLKLHRESIPNLFVVCGEAVVFSRHYVAAGSISEVYVNFPDPWPKLRHAKHRLIRQNFLLEVERVLCEKGKGTFVTDDVPYATEMLSQLSQNPALKFVLPQPHFATEWPNYGPSYFKALWMSKGLKIHYIPFHKA